jgi:hypothetical protein
MEMPGTLQPEYGWPMIEATNGPSKMKIAVQEDTKQLLAKFGPNKLFGDDVDQRKRPSGSDAVLLFDRVWKDTLEHQVRFADRCRSEDGKNDRHFLEMGHSHRFSSIAPDFSHLTVHHDHHGSSSPRSKL